ncbi:MAG: hypothetical protein N2662_11700 [Bacteroidales bacterium]|nr:hypothetical protein [Bacteroidales bacterium]
MDCISCRELINMYGTKRLTALQKEELEFHVNHCKECEKIYRLEGWLVTLVEQEKSWALSPDFTYRIMNEISNHNIQVKNFAPVIPKYMHKAIAVFLLLFALASGILMGNLYSNNKQYPIELVLLNDAKLESFSKYLAY